MKKIKTLPMEQQIHEMMNNSSFDHLFGNIDAPAEMRANIGRLAKYIWEPSMGTFAKTAIFKIGSIQRNYKGDLCYRVYATTYDDTFGRVMSPDECNLLPNN